MSRGVIYKATGNDYINEVKISAKSVKNNMNSIQTALITDSDRDDFNNIDNKVSISEMPNDYSASILDIDHIPYDQAIYLDSDTRLVEDISGIYSLLQNYDLAATLTPESHSIHDIDKSYPVINTGFLIFNTCPKIGNLFDQWSKNYIQLRENKGVINDQPAFAMSLHESEIRYTILPREYNTFALSVGQIANTPKVLHGRPQKNLQKVGQQLTKNTSEIRVYKAWKSITGSPSLEIHRRKDEKLRFKLYHSISEDGLLNTIKKIEQTLNPIK